VFSLKLSKQNCNNVRRVLPTRRLSCNLRPRREVKAANLESAINEKLKSLPPDKQQQVLEFVEELANGNPRETVSQKLERYLRSVPAAELEELPSDASENLDHYLY
jgi:hypothetical protein